MNTNTEKLSILEKTGYSLGDLAANLIFQTLMMFLAYYYVDVYKLSSGHASTIILTGGLLGACFNLIMGPIADRTRTRWGKFRPWILWTSIPFALSAILAFTTPDFGTTGKIIYAFTTFVFLMMMYSMNNLPYSALSGVLTGNMAERNSLSSYRFIAVQVALFIVQVLLLPLMLILGNGDKALGFKTVMIIFSISGVIMFIVTFLTTKERIVPQKEQTGSVKQDFNDLIHNKPWIIMLSLTILIFIGLGLKIGLGVYYFNNYVSEPHLGVFLNDIKFGSFMKGINNILVRFNVEEYHWQTEIQTTSFSLFNALGAIFGIIGILVSKPLADKFGKKDAFIFGLSLSTIFILTFYFFSRESVGFMFISQILQTFFYGITTPLLWAMIADVADYSEWKNNRRATAIIFSAMIFGLKAGMSLGQASIPLLLGMFGYNADVSIQSPETIEGIKLSVSIFSAIPYIIGIVLLFKYEIDKKMEIMLERELVNRRKE